jgi:hypothetical protein
LRETEVAVEGHGRKRDEQKTNYENKENIYTNEK